MLITGLATVKIWGTSGSSRGWWVSTKPWLEQVQDRTDAPGCGLRRGKAALPCPPRAAPPPAPPVRDTRRAAQRASAQPRRAGGIVGTRKSKENTDCLFQRQNRQ